MDDRRNLYRTAQSIPCRQQRYKCFTETIHHTKIPAAGAVAKRRGTVITEHSRDDAPDRGELADLIAHCDTFEEKFIIVALSHTGMRKGELQHMTVNWVRWRDDYIRIPAEQRCLCAHCNDNKWTPKNPQSARDIEIMDPQLSKVLSEYFQEGVNSVKEHYSQMQIWRICKRVARRLDDDVETELDKTFEERIYPHSLRACFASMLADNGSSANGLMDTMGWKDITTARNYIRSSGRAGKREGRELREAGGFGIL